jgi:hypothetical protein
VLGGGAIGAGTGAIVGNALGNPAAGALLGGVVGGVSGGLIGNEIERSERRTDARIRAATAAPPPPILGLTDVIQLAQNQVGDGVIISQIRASGSVFHLSAQDTLFLKQNGVSDVVIQEMLATGARAPRVVPLAGPPVVYAQPVCVVPPPPVGIGVGVGYTFGRGRCCR